MKRFFCTQSYRSVHADSGFYKGSFYYPIDETDSHIIFRVEHDRFEFSKTNPLFKSILIEKPFKFGR